MTGRTCSHPDCDRPHHSHDLCVGHWGRVRRGSSLTGPISTAAVAVDDDVFMPCPESLEALVARCVELDAKAIVRTLWPHLLEASLAGVEPFTLEAAS